MISRRMVRDVLIAGVNQVSAPIAPHTCYYGCAPHSKESIRINWQTYLKNFVSYGSWFSSLTQ